MRRLIPLWAFRVMPNRWVRWLFRRELAAGQAYVEKMGWEHPEAER